MKEENGKEESRKEENRKEENRKEENGKEEKGVKELEEEMIGKLNQMAETYRSVEIPKELRGRVLKAMDRGRREADRAEREERTESAEGSRRVKRTEGARSAEGSGRTERTERTEGARSTEGSGRTERTRNVNRSGTKSRGSRRSDKRGTGGIYMIRKILVRTGQTAAAVLVVLTVLANSNADIAYAMGKIPVVGAITRVVTFRTYEKAQKNYEAKIEVPKVEPESGSGMSQAASEINQSVEDYTSRLIAQFEQDEKDEEGKGHRALYSDYQVVTDNDKLFTLRINVNEIMASSSGSVKIYNVDKKTDKIITLKDLFPAGTDYVKILSDAARQQMKKNMAEDENKMYFLDDGMGSDFEAIQPDQNFYINAAGHLVLVFDEYEVAPGAMGVVEIEIPGDVFQYQW